MREGSWLAGLPDVRILLPPDASVAVEVAAPDEHALSADGYNRPFPPQFMRTYGRELVRALDVESLVALGFTRTDGVFFDPEHEHLTTATIGVIWSNARHMVKGEEKAGMMELLPDPDSEPRTWTEARKHDWLASVYGRPWPRFQMTLSGVWSWVYDDRSFLALVDHELCHAAVARDEGGAMKHRPGSSEPIWKTRGHDVEQFVGTVRRWGAPAAGAAELVAAAAAPPRFEWVPGRAFAPIACANCAARGVS